MDDAPGTSTDSLCPLCGGPAPTAAACPQCGARVATGGAGSTGIPTLVVDMARFLKTTKPKSDTAEMDRFVNALAAAWGPFSRVVLDMSALEQINSMWMGRFVILGQRSKSDQKALRIVIPRDNRYVMQAFQVTRLDKILPVFENVEGALA